MYSRKIFGRKECAERLLQKQKRHLWLHLVCFVVGALVLAYEIWRVISFINSDKSSYSVIITLIVVALLSFLTVSSFRRVVICIYSTRKIRKDKFVVAEDTLSRISEHDRRGKWRTRYQSGYEAKLFFAQSGKYDATENDISVVQNAAVGDKFYVVYVDRKKIKPELVYNARNYEYRENANIDHSKVTLKKRIDIKKLIGVVVVIVIIGGVAVGDIISKMSFEGEMLMIQTRSDMLVVAHAPDMSYAVMGKTVEMQCIFKDGQITITDETNGKTYKGTYKMRLSHKRNDTVYDIVIEGQEGYANATGSSFMGKQGLMYIYVGDYFLTFAAD